MIYLNGIGIVQSGNEYLLYLPSKICVAHVVMPPDQAYVADAEVLKYITKALAKRWGVDDSRNSDRRKC